MDDPTTSIPNLIGTAAPEPHERPNSLNIRSHSAYDTTSHAQRSATTGPISTNRQDISPLGGSMPEHPILIPSSSPPRSASTEPLTTPTHDRLADDPPLSASPFPHPTNNPHSTSHIADRKRRLTTEEVRQERRGSAGRPGMSEASSSRHRSSLRGAAGLPEEGRRHVPSRSASTLIDLTSSPAVQSDTRREGGTHPRDSESEGVQRGGGEEIVLPRWQDDAEAPECQVCGTPFTFWYRKHHCRKCGRVVCSGCSPHRITLPRQYIVQPPNASGSAASNPIDLTGDSPRRARDRRSNQYINPALGGGAEVRVCNPCVPDPNFSPPPQQPPAIDPRQYWTMPSQPGAHPVRGSSRGSVPSYSPLSPFVPPGAESGANRGQHHRSSSHSPFPAFAAPGARANRDVNLSPNPPHAGPATYYNPSPPMYPGNHPSNPPHQPFPNSPFYMPPSYRPVPSTPHPATAAASYPSPHPQLHAVSPDAFRRDVLAHLQRRARDLGLGNAEPTSSARRAHEDQVRELYRQHAARSARYRQRSHDGQAPLPPVPPAPQPPPRRTVAEEDECPVCGAELPPKGPNGEETVRERHVEECIQGHFVSSPSGGPASTALATGTPTTETGAAPARADGGPGGSAPRPRRVTGARGMLVWKASEKDCFDEDGGEQECIICFDEFVPGAELGRLECWCKFHANCIREWWAAKGTGTCPTHQLTE